MYITPLFVAGLVQYVFIPGPVTSSYVCMCNAELLYFAAGMLSHSRRVADSLLGVAFHLKFSLCLSVLYLLFIAVH